ncbi:MAG: hypothetical protein SOZ27_00635 [Spirochaetia bacterium]|nr:hypothetical protein [Spirochaetia bacterium]
MDKILKIAGLALGTGVVAAAGVYVFKKVKEMIEAEPIIHSPWGPYSFGGDPEEETGEKNEKNVCEQEPVFVDAL